MTFFEYLDRRAQRIARSPANQWGDPRVAITGALIGLFAYAYVHNPTEAMTGALIAAFAAAYGYWIGASKGATTLNENLGKSLDLAAANAPVPPKPDVTLQPGETAQAAPIDDPDAESRP